MGSERPTDTEQQLLLATWRLGEGAYGVSIRDELRKRTGRRIAVGAVYSTMIRLEKRGWVRSRLSDPTPVRGGKAKRLFRVTPAGKQALEDARVVMERLWEGLEAPEPGGDRV